MSNRRRVSDEMLQEVIEETLLPNSTGTLRLALDLQDAMKVIADMQRNFDEVVETADRLREENEKLKARHAPEVCVDVQDYCDNLKAENERLREEVRRNVSMIGAFQREGVQARRYIEKAYKAIGGGDIDATCALLARKGE